MEHPCEDALMGHDAVAHPLPDGAAVVALLADLGDLQQDIPKEKAELQMPIEDAMFKYMTIKGGDELCGVGS